ncbi:MAG: non-canonical purine NTP pyrophosphatase, partial [Bacteroidota bacterium]|nr:non-canonical purine NTP pyrophosphatase [Bacteroidota bacterium]
MKLVFATTNAHKLQEVRAMLPDLEIVDLNGIGFTEEVEETGVSFEEN